MKIEGKSPHDANQRHGDVHNRAGTRASSRGKSRSSNNSRADTGTFVTGIDADDEEDEEGGEGGLVIPSSLLTKSLNATGKMQGGDQGKLHAAIHALRHALKASDDTGMALKIDDPRTGVNRPNASYRARALPKKPYMSKLEARMRAEEKGGEGDGDFDDAKAMGGGGEPIRAVTPGVINAAIQAKVRVRGRGARSEATKRCEYHSCSNATANTAASFPRRRPLARARSTS